MSSRKFTGSPFDFRSQVFEDSAPIPSKLDQIREFCLCLDEWRAEDAKEISDLRKELKDIKRAVTS